MVYRQRAAECMHASSIFSSKQFLGFLSFSCDKRKYWTGEDKTTAAPPRKKAFSFVKGGAPRGPSHTPTQQQQQQQQRQQIRFFIYQFKLCAFPCCCRAASREAVAAAARQEGPLKEAKGPPLRSTRGAPLAAAAAAALASIQEPSCSGRWPAANTSAQRSSKSSSSSSKSRLATAAAAAAEATAAAAARVEASAEEEDAARMRDGGVSAAA
ncbi:hypothetical protein Efla_004164 [Eimeria flavescens]